MKWQGGKYLGVLLSYASVRCELTCCGGHDIGGGEPRGVLSPGEAGECQTLITWLHTHLHAYIHTIIAFPYMANHLKE